MLVIEERDESPVYMDLLTCLLCNPDCRREGHYQQSAGMGDASLIRSLIIAAYYLNNDITTALRTTRGYAYTLVDLFRGMVSVENGWEGIHRKFGYYEAVDEHHSICRKNGNRVDRRIVFYYTEPMIHKV